MSILNEEMTTEKMQFIEKLGLYYEGYGIPRIGGKILGFLLIVNAPVSAEEMSNTIKVSRSSVSTNLKLLLSSGLIEIKPQHGDRVDYYVIAERAWENAIKIRIQGFQYLKLLLKQGLNAIGEENRADDKLTDMLNWTDMMLNNHEKMMSEWIRSKEK